MTRLIIFLIPGMLLLATGVRAGILDWFNTDPWYSGCAYDSLGKKIDCVKFYYNESKSRGSRAKAEQLCYSELRSIVRNYKGQYSIECSDSAGPFGGQFR